MCVSAYDAQISLMANMHAGISNRTHIWCMCADLCGFSTEISRHYLLSNVCSLEEAQKPSVRDVAAESLSDGSRSKLNTLLEHSHVEIFLIVSSL